MQSSDLVILTGGLGPTEDDVTRDAVAAALGVGQHYDASVWHQIEERLKKFKRTPSENNRRQADILDGADVLPNPNGTAPGQWFRRAGKIVAMLPGPPRELKPMVAAELLPRLREVLPPMAIRARWYRVALMGESDLDSLIAPVYTRYSNPVTTILAAAGDIDIHLRARCETAEEAEALLDELGTQIERLLGDRTYSNNGDSLSKTVGNMLRAAGETVAVAESCTGGLLGATITEVSGSSDYFVGGFLTYSSAAKTAMLNVPASLIEEHSAVSEAVAIAMASGARAETGATYALSVTGYADGDQAGLVYIGLATPQHTHARRLNLFGDRQRVRGLAVINCLDWLRRSIAPESR